MYSSLVPRHRGGSCMHALNRHRISLLPPLQLGMRLAHLDKTLTVVWIFFLLLHRVLFKQVDTTGPQRDGGRKDKVCQVYRTCKCTHEASLSLLHLLYPPSFFPTSQSHLLHLPLSPPPLFLLPCSPLSSLLPPPSFSFPLFLPLS